MNESDVVVHLNKLLHTFDSEDVDDGFNIYFTINDDAIRELSSYSGLLDLFQVSFLVDDVHIELDELSRSKGKEAVASLSFELLRDDGLAIYKNWESFLSYKPNLIEVPESFCIYKDGSLYPSDCQYSRVANYIDVIDFIKILVTHADYKETLSDTVVKEIIFLHKSKIEIGIQLNDASVLNDGLDGISIVTSMFEDVSHKEHKTSILKEVLHSLLSNVPVQDRLEHLIEHFGEFSTRLHENYQLFVSEFSFDDVRKEYEEEKREYIIKINDVFSSIQTRMLGIPVALVLASMKLSVITDVPTFIGNAFLLVAIITYVIMMLMLLSNQKHTLFSLREEYMSHMRRLKHQYSDQYDSVIEIIEGLDRRYDHQEKNLVIFQWLLISLGVMTFALFLWNLPWMAMIK